MSVCVRVAGAEVLQHTAGFASRAPCVPAAPTQVFDLASLTKALCTAPVVAALLGDGALRLDTPVADALPHFDRRVTVGQLLAHSSGLAAWAPLYEGITNPGTTAARAEIIAKATHAPLTAPPGARHVYSDLGFLTLLAIVEAVTGSRIDRVFAQRVADPAGVSLSWGSPDAAATEDCPVRGGVVQGVVHDLNAFAMGGVSSHAGLFGSADAVARLAEALLDAAEGRRDDMPSLASQWRAAGPGSHRGGWDTVTQGGYTSTGSFWPADGRGHLGYTGTSLWVAPRRRTVVAMLTNRVHPTDVLGPIRAARPRIHDAIARALGWDTSA